MPYGKLPNKVTRSLGNDTDTYSSPLSWELIRITNWESHLTSFCHWCLKSFSVNVGPRYLWTIPKNVSQSSLVAARGCSKGCPPLLHHSWLSIVVVTSRKVSLVNPLMLSIGLKYKNIQYCKFTASHYSVWSGKVKRWLQGFLCDLASCSLCHRWNQFSSSYRPLFLERKQITQFTGVHMSPTYGRPHVWKIPIRITLARWMKAVKSYGQCSSFFG